MSRDFERISVLSFFFTRFALGALACIRFGDDVRFEADSDPTTGAVSGSVEKRILRPVTRTPA